MIIYFFKNPKKLNNRSRMNKLECSVKDL